MKIYDLSSKSSDLVNVLSGLTIGSFVGYSIYKFTKHKTDNKKAASAAGVLSGLGTVFAPPPVKLVAMAGSTAAIASVI